MGCERCGATLALDFEAPWADVRAEIREFMQGHAPCGGDVEPPAS